MQNATAGQYRSQAAQYSAIADQHEDAGRIRQAGNFREMAEDCEARAQQAESQ